jgi:hypothetical protein
MIKKENRDDYWDIEQLDQRSGGGGDTGRWRRVRGRMERDEGRKVGGHKAQKRWRLGEVGTPS